MGADVGPVLVHARHGDLYCYPTDRYLGESIFKFGEYGEKEYQFLRDVLEGYPHAGNDIIEVGANAGYLTLPLTNHGRVVCLEPQPSVYQMLLNNMVLNNLPVQGKAWPIPRACSSSPGSVDCPDIPYSVQTNHGGISMNVKGNFPTVKVPCTTLEETFLPDQCVKLIKVDVEGMEEKVLRGGRQLIARDRPILYVENDRLELSESLIKLVWSLDYWCAFHLPPLYNPDNFFRNPSNPWGNVVSINMVCVPNGQRLPAGVAIKHGLQLVEDAKQHPMRGEA